MTENSNNQKIAVYNKKSISWARVFAPRQKNIAFALMFFIKEIMKPSEIELLATNFIGRQLATMYM